MRIARVDSKPKEEGGGIWVEERIPGGWVALVRVAWHSGRLVPLELRLSPTGRRPPRDLGINRDVIRKVPLGSFAPFVLGAARFYGTAPIGGLREHLAEPLFQAIPPLRQSADKPRPRPRRSTGRDDEFYAELAWQYVGLLEQNSRKPVAELAAVRGEKPARMRDMIREARERGLLSMGKSGQRGGVLLPRAESLLARKDGAR